MSSSGASDRKPYMTATTMEPTHMSSIQPDPSQGPLRAMPNLSPYPQQAMSYASFHTYQQPQPQPQQQQHHLHHQQHQQHPPPLSNPPHHIAPPNPRKRRASETQGLSSMHQQLAPSQSAVFQEPHYGMPSSSGDMGTTMAIPARKKSRTNTPWTPGEEHRLKIMRDQGQSWSEIAKGFPARTEGSVKKHWYKDMHYAEFAEDESAALLAAIKEYEASKWKVIGQKVGKPAKACEQYAKEHFGMKS